MKRIYTDERFPGVEVVNESTTSFSVYTQGELTGSFVGYETPRNKVSEQFAARRAREYFDEMDNDAKAEDDLPDHSEHFNVPAAELKGIKADDVLDIYDKAKKESDPLKRKRLMAQAHGMSQKFESDAAQIAASLID